MEDLGRIVVQLAHVVSGVLWIGGGFYTVLVQLPALAVMPMPARGPALAAIGPRQVRYILRVAELTLATGVLQIFVNPHRLAPPPSPPQALRPPPRADRAGDRATPRGRAGRRDR